jgi:hypothetical protein
MDSYDRATSAPYGYLLIDLSPNGDKKFQLRTNIFKGEDLIVFTPRQ